MLLGIWQSYEQLEESLSMPELVGILVAHKNKLYEEQKFLAAIQGIDLDKETSRSSSSNPWEDMKARVFSGGQAGDSNDILALQGINAQKAGFGIGLGLEYSDLKGEEPQNPFG